RSAGARRKSMHPSRSADRAFMGPGMVWDVGARGLIPRRCALRVPNAGGAESGRPPPYDDRPPRPPPAADTLLRPPAVGPWVGLIVAALAPPPRVEAQSACGCLPGNFCPVNPHPLPYTGDIPSNCRETYRVFVPDPAVVGPRPAEGWPALIYFDLGGF